jgi:GNAT superfamily N-acetyltransferase
MQLSPLTLDAKLAWAELLSISFDRSAKDMACLLEWFHEGHTVIAWGLWDGSRLAAQYACLLMPLCLPHTPDPVLVGLSLNMAVHPDYRGRGLIKQVSKPVYESIAARRGIAGIGFSNAAGVRVDRNSKGYGYQVVGQMQPSLIWLSHRRHARLLELTDAWPETTWHEIPSNYEAIHFPVYGESLRHRYARHPFRRYRYAVWHENSELQGIVIYRPIRLGGFLGAALLGAYSTDLPELLTRWARTMRHVGVHLIHILTTPCSQLRSALLRVGTSVNLPYSRSPYFLTVKPLDSYLPDQFFQFSAWDVAGGDIL